MTCIAWDGRTLAADKRCCSGSMINTVTKIHRVGDVLVGGSGEMDFVLQMVDWVRNGRLPDKFPADQRNKDDWQPTLVVEADGTTSVYNRTPYPIRHEQRCVAIGSGREYAMAAMHLGKTAREAVEVACALDPGCGNGIDCLDLSGGWTKDCAQARAPAPLTAAEYLRWRGAAGLGGLDYTMSKTGTADDAQRLARNIGLLPTDEFISAFMRSAPGDVLMCGPARVRVAPALY